MRTIGDWGHEPAGPMWEVYWTDPSAEPNPSTWRTEILIPVT
jgi:effector-binding domain-containing protein